VFHAASLEYPAMSGSPLAKIPKSIAYRMRQVRMLLVSKKPDSTRQLKLSFIGTGKKMPLRSYPMGDLC